MTKLTREVVFSSKEHTFENAFADCYPLSPFPGVLPRRPFLAPVGEHAPSLSPDDERTLVEITRSVNSALLSESKRMTENGDTSPYFTRMMSGQETDASIIRVVQTSLQIAQNDPDIHFVCPPAGATPLARLAVNMGLPLDHVHGAVVIEGSRGTVTGHASLLQHTVPEAITNPIHTIILLEDVIDSLESAQQLVVLRNQLRDPMRFNIQYWDNLSRDLLAAHRNGNLGEQTYDEFARACRSENVIIAPVFSKNPMFEDFLRYIANPTVPMRHDPLGTLQTMALQALTPVENKWIMGAGLLDTGIVISRVVELHPDIKQSPLVLRVMKDEGNQWLLRIGTAIEGLVCVDRPQHEPNMVALVAEAIRSVQ